MSTAANAPKHSVHSERVRSREANTGPGNPDGVDADGRETRSDLERQPAAEQNSGRVRERSEPDTTADRSPRRDRDPHHDRDPRDRDDTATGRRAVVGREKEEYGGMKFGACFFGWLTASGTAVLLTALLAATGTAIGLGQGIDPAAAAQSPQTLGLVGGIALMVIVLLAYLAGGYVAGRMARFNGAKQGLGVWLWAVIVAVVAAVLGLIAGSQFDMLSQLDGLPRIPINEGTLTTGGIIAAVTVAVVSLLGAILGGLAGMRYHRKVDVAGLGR